MFGDMFSLEDARRLVENERSLGAINRLEKLYEVLKLYGVEDYVSFDLGMLSKYNYYTGVIFRAYTYGVGDAIVKGGRYDNLLKQFGKNAPAVGFVVVVDSILEALARQKVDVAIPKEAQVVYYSPENYQERLGEAQKLRNQGIPVTLVSENSAGYKVSGKESGKRYE